MPIMIAGSAALGAVGSIFSGIMGGSASGKAARLAAESAREALAFNKQVYGETKQALSPYRQAGEPAAGNLQNLFSGQANITSLLNADPLFNWQSQELERFNARKLAKLGLGNSGAGLELNSRGYQQLLGDNAQRYFNNNMAGAQLGANAAAGQGQAGSAAAGNASNTLMSAAQVGGQALQNQGVAYGNIGTGIANQVNAGLGTYLNNQNFQQLVQAMKPAPTQPGPFSGGYNFGTF